MKWLTLVAFVGVCGLLLGALMSVAIAVGLAAGYCLHWLVPGIDMGLATVVGELSFFCVALVVALCLLASSYRHLAENVSDGDENEGWSDEQVEYVADQVSETVLANLDRSSGSRGRSSRPRPRR